MALLRGGFGDRPEDNPDQRITVPKRCVYVVGDDRDNSRDSRHFGPIHAGDVVGYVQYIYTPAESWSRFGTVQ